MLCHLWLLRLLRMISYRRGMVLSGCLCRSLIAFRNLVEESAETAHGVYRGRNVHVVCEKYRGEDAEAEDE
jgi:hypothetical protein